MSVDCRWRPLHRDEIAPLITDCCWTPASASARGVGLEAELFPIWIDATGAPAGRVPLAQVSATLPEGGLAGRFSLEPGGQVEYSTAVHARPASVLGELDAATDRLASELVAHRVVLASAGLDVWHPLVPQQSARPRYPAMAAYFARRRSHAGAVMMRHTASLQVNLDLGSPPVAAERWLVANLAAPLLVATFASSPTVEGVSGRAIAWQRVDPTRTGFPVGLLRGDADPVETLTEAALAADVLLVRTAGSGVEPGVPGWTFGDWMRDGHETHGRPCLEDLQVHLTTLFHEVRARRFLEIRCIDALPRRWWSVPVVLLAGLLYDDQARERVRGMLERHRGRLPQLLHTAARVGVADPALCALAVETWWLALAGVARLPAGAVRDPDLPVVEDFLDRFTLRGRCPADELRERLADSPTAGLAWAAHPVETSVGC